MISDNEGLYSTLRLFNGNGETIFFSVSTGAFKIRKGVGRGYKCAMPGTQLWYSSYLTDTIV